MSTYTENFEEAAGNASWTLPPWVAFATDSTINGGAAFAMVDTDLPPEFLPAPSSNLLCLFCNDPGSKATLTITGDFAPLGAIDFDFAMYGSGDSTYQFILDGFVLDGNPPPHAWQHEHLTTGAGTHTLVIEFDANSANWDPGLGAAVVLDNLVVTNANSVVNGTPDGGGTGGGTTAPPYARGDWVKHLGGVYIARADGVTTEPGPGDSADWFEVVARPAAPYSPNPADLPVRAGVDNPFAAGEKGIWYQLDTSGNVIGQVYEDGT